MKNNSDNLYGGTDDMPQVILESNLCMMGRFKLMCLIKKLDIKTCPSYKLTLGYNYKMIEL